MAKLTGALMSLGARGSIAKTLTFASARGVPYVRQTVIPSNPRTTEQTLTRNNFSFLSSVWKVAPALFTAPWTLYARGKVLTDRNALVKFNLPVLRGEVDLANFVFSPGALGGLPPIAAVATPGVGQLSVAVTPPAVIPTDWTIAAAVVAVIADQNPQTGILYEITAGEDLTDPYAVVLTGLDAVLYQVGAWLRWTRPDGSIAYSPSIVTTGTPT